MQIFLHFFIKYMKFLLKRHKNSEPEFAVLGGMWGSNPRHSEPQSDALPTELRPPCRVRQITLPDVALRHKARDCLRYSNDKLAFLIRAFVVSSRKAGAKIVYFFDICKYFSEKMCYARHYRIFAISNMQINSQSSVHGGWCGAAPCVCSPTRHGARTQVRTDLRNAHGRSVPAR